VVEAIILAAGSLVGADTLPSLPRGGGWRSERIVVAADTTFSIRDAWLIDEAAWVVVGDTAGPAEVAVVWQELHEVFIGRLRGELTPGDTISVKWRSAAPGRELELRRYRPMTEVGDSADSQTVPIARSGGDYLSPWGGMRRSGFISRGVAIDAGGGQRVASGMHLELTGEPSPGVSVEAVLDDRSLPAGTGSSGSTTLGELDRIVLQVRTRRMEASLGDADLTWRNGRFGRVERQLKGGRASFGGRDGRIETAGGGGEKLTHTLRLDLSPGDQGPYELTDREGRHGITVAAGSEVVHLDGRLLKRGAFGDYRIDYERGTITLGPTTLIRTQSRLEVEYEYTGSAYPVVFYGMDGEVPFKVGGARFSAGATLAREEQNGGRPVAFDWNDERRAVVERAGDDALSARASGIDSVAYGEGDYIWADESGNRRVLQFSPPDSLGRPTGNLRVAFGSDSQGGYTRRYNPDWQLFYFEWIGEGLGSWSPTLLLPLPDRRQLVHVRGEVVTGNLRSRLETAFSEYDRNTRSLRDDGDNRGAALLWSGRWSEAKGRIALDLSLRREDANFRPLSARREVDYNYRWNLPSDDAADESAVEAGMTLKPLERLTITGSAGSLDRVSRTKAQRWESGAEGAISSLRLKGGYSGANSRQSRTGAVRLRRRWDVGSEWTWGAVTPSLIGGLEEQVADSSGMRSGRAVQEVTPGLRWGAGVREAYAAIDYRSDDSLQAKVRTAISRVRTVRAGWKDRQSWGGWTTDLYRRQIDHVPGSDTEIGTGARAALNLSPANQPFRFTAAYDLTTGRSRSDRSVATYVGPGRGTWRREGDRYVPDPRGDFELGTAPGDSLERATRVEASGEFEWRFTRKLSPTRRESTYPLGISRSVTRFEAKGSSPDTRKSAILFLDRGALFGRSASPAHWQFENDLYFLEGHPAGDGRLALKRRIERSSGYLSGEDREESVALRIRYKPREALTFTLEPQREWIRRGRAYGGSANAFDLFVIDGEAHYEPPGSDYLWRPALGWSNRRDAAKGIILQEWRVEPRVIRRFSERGSVSLETGWRRLAADADIFLPHELLRGYRLGNNFTSALTADYSIGRQLTLAISARSLWRGREKPIPTGLVEMRMDL